MKWVLKIPNNNGMFAEGINIEAESFLQKVLN
jgi:hypothetical protein